MRDQLEKQTNPEHNIWVNNEDFAAGCAMDGAKPPAFCYTVNADAETAKLMVDMWNLKEIREGDVVFHCCMRDLTEYMRNLDQVKCKDLGKKVSLRMDNLANTMIHEYTCVIPFLFQEYRTLKADCPTVIGLKLDLLPWMSF